MQDHRHTLAMLLAGALAVHAGPLLAQVGQQPAREARAARPTITPYIEAAQVLSAELQPGNEVLTYTSLAAGVDAAMTGRHSEAALSLRYERRIGWGDASDGDTISGIARGSLALVPRMLALEAGALAARTRIEGSGASSIGGFGGNDANTSQVYSVYAGPSLQTGIGRAELTASYRIGYTRLESPDAVVLSPGAAPIDLFDDSVVQAAGARIGIAPGAVLPIGLGAGAGWNRQDISNLDQRIDDRHARADATLPLSPTFALVGGVGYEEVEISSRDAVRDANGNPVIGSDGRFVTDASAPRRIAYQTDGLIWDAGVLWRPSRRTSLAASVGRRYGSTTYYGALAYAPDRRTSINLSVYDNLTGFGGVLTNGLAGLGTNFSALRNPITGDLAGCVAGIGGANCLLAGLGSVRSAVFRNRGVAGTIGRDLGRTQLGLGTGYDRRRFVAAAGTVLEGADGLVEENYWIAAYANRQLDRQSTLGFTASANWFESGLDNAGNGMGYSATLAYYRNFLGGLTGTAAVGLDGITRESLPDFATASALLGLRYSFR